MTRISVAMTTYNGERFIAEQLESLAAQTHAPHELVVCDDGSKDATLQIVEAFAEKAPFPVRLVRNEKNLGFADNFFQAARLCEGDWVAFCDQDDVWLADKLEAAAKAIARTPDATMVLQNAILSDEALESRGRLFPARIAPGVYGPLRQQGYCVWLGFLMTARRDLFERLDVIDRPLNYHPDIRLQSHDRWTCMIANALGGVVVLDGAAALYRRHGTALTGAYADKSLMDRVREAKGVGAAQYAFAGEVAASAAAYMRRIAEGADRADWGARFRAASGAYDRLQQVQALRASLYDDGAGMVRRGGQYMKLWLRGGYVGPRFWALGLRSAAKDAAHVVLG